MSTHGRRGGRHCATRGSRFGARPGPPHSSLPSLPKGELLDELKPSQLSSDELGPALNGPIGIEHVKVIASYNWVGKESPTIMIPGKPALWIPLDSPEKLSEDNGKKETYYADLDAAYAFKHALDPALTAVMAMEPTCLGMPELFACGSTLGNLLRFARGVAPPFRILVKTVDSTVHLVRRLSSPTEVIEDIHGYGHSFPNAYTTWEASVKQSNSHQRVMRYQLGGLTTLIRYEGDGYISDSREAETKADPDADDLTNLFGNLSTTSGDATYRYKDAPLKLEDGGEHVAQEQIYDLKTRSSKRMGEDIMGGEMPRLWIRQISKFILAFHDRGTFTDIEHFDTRNRIDDWEKANQEGIERFMRCLHWIISKAREERYATSGFELVFDGSGALEMREKPKDAGDPLSDTVLEQWRDWLANGRGQEGKTAVDGDKGDSALHEYDGPYEQGYDGLDSGDEDDGDDDKDLTACDKECGYCGRCPY